MRNKIKISRKIFKVIIIFLCIAVGILVTHVIAFFVTLPARRKLPWPPYYLAEKQSDFGLGTGITYRIDDVIAYDELSLKYRLFISESEYYSAETINEYLELFSKINAVPHTNKPSIISVASTDTSAVASQIIGSIDIDGTTYNLNYILDVNENIFTGKLEISRFIIEYSVVDNTQTSVI